MNRRRVQIVILCEDLQHEVFVFRFLKKIKKANRRNVTVRRSPKGRGSGAQYVIEHFPEEVRAFRSKPHLNLCLVVVVDADTLSVEDRIRKLEESLRTAGQSGRTEEERIVMVIPRRNIETWIAYLDGNEVDETSPYPKLSQQSQCEEALKRLVELYRNDLPEDLPASLRHASNETQRCSTQESVA